MAIDPNNIATLDFPCTWIKGATDTQIGGRAENQDFLGSAETPFGHLVVVCDGMGGGPAGATASHIAVEEIIKGVQETDVQESRVNAVKKAVRRANEAIVRQGMEDPTVAGMGSTCVVLLLNEDSAVAAHVGDSRIYQLRGNKKVWRTWDHSMVFGLVKQGILTEEQARLSSDSNIITRALGVKRDIEVDCEEIPFRKGDRFVLTTDGVHGSMPENEFIVTVANQGVKLEKQLSQLSAQVEEIGQSHGGHHDNNTIAILDVSKKSKLKATMSRTAKQLLIAMGIVLCASIVLNIILWVKVDNQPKTDVADNAESAILVSTSDKSTHGEDSGE